MLGAAVPAVAAGPCLPMLSHVTAELRNWSGTYQFTAHDVITARTVDEVQQTVAKAKADGGRVRAIGTRHSFNDLADNGATLVSVAGIAPDPEIDEAKGTITVGAGTSYGALAAWLQDRGWALGNLGSLPHISIAGATATGTHGSGSGNQVLSAAVAGLQYVAADGELRQADRSAPDFAGLPVGLGAFGIVVRIALDIQPSYLVRQDAYTHLPWDRTLEDLDAIMDAAYSVSLFTDWQKQRVNEVWLKVRTDASPKFVAQPEFFGATLAKKNLHPIAEISPENCTEQMGVAGPWYERLPHFRMGFMPSAGKELQSEYFVPRPHAVEAILAIERLRDIVRPQLLISEIRTIAADDLWMSTAYKRDSVALHFTWKQDWPAVSKVLPEIERELAPFEPRPHWGKLFTMAPAQLRSRYERLEEFVGLAKKLDPRGKFRNAFLERNIFA